MNVVIRKILKASALLFVAVFIFQFFSSTSAYAATRTWTGATNGSWSLASNWGGTAPVTGDDLVFPNGASNLSNTNDLTENTIFNSITFSGSGYTLSGNKIILGPGLAGITDSVASGGNTIALDIRLDATRDIFVTNTAESLTISGRIAGVGGINKEGTGTLILSGANTYGGITKINVGVINARHATALGTIATGTEVVGNAALEFQGSINVTYESLTLRGYGVSGGGALRNISGDNIFGGLITLTSAGGAEISSDSGTLTIKGGTTGNFPLVFDGSGNITFSTAPISGSGAITKNGAGTLTYNFPNTYTGLTTINAGTLLYGVDNAILSGAITVTGGTLDIATYSDMVGTVTLGTLDLASGTITGSTGVLSSAIWTVYNGTISAIIAGDAGALTKSTPGTVFLTRPNQYTGATTISAGILEIQDSYALGLIDGITTVSAGATLQIDGDGLSIPEYITFSGTGHLYTGAIRNTTGDNTLTGLLTLGAAAMVKSDVDTTLIVDSKGLSATTLGLTIGGEGNITFTSTAPIYGTTATLTKQNSGTLTLQGFNNFTGATNLNRGSIVLSTAGAMPLSAITIGSEATLTLDNSSTTILNRISDSAALTMNGGSFNFIGNATGTASETAGALTLSTGHNTATVTPGAGGSTTMTFASYSRSTGASVLFRGASLGDTPGPNVSTIMFTATPTIVGGSGAANSATISILKSAFGDDSLSGTGSDMVTYNVGNTNGVRLLNSVGFSGEYSSTLATNANVKLTADTVASTASVNSLILNGYSITNPGSAVTLTLVSGSLAGNLLINSANNISGANTTLGIGAFELMTLASANSTISATIGTAVAGNFTLGGTGNVTLSAANAYTGTTYINNATFTAGVSNAISSGGVTVVGGTYDIGNFSDTVGAVTLQNGTITGGSGVLTSTASYSLREGTVSAIIAGAVAVTRVATSAVLDSVVTLTRNNTYTGATTITSGILRLGGTGDGTNTPLGTTAAGTTIASGGALDLNGYTLGTAEAITSLNGTGFGASGSSNMGAIMNSSASSASYSGALTLAAASRINADYGELTISGNASGNFALTFGGFSNLTYSGVRSGTSTIVKDGIGTLTLSNGNSSYTGVTTISVGTVKVGAASVGGTNSPLGTTGGATTVALGSRLDLNGFNLGINEPLTLNGVGYGLGDFASGALINSSGSSVSHGGAITLGSTGVLVKVDFGNMTLSGNVGGNTFGIILGGTGTGTLSGVIGTTSGTVTKIGTGSWTLSNAANTFTGATSVNNGTLKLGVSGGATNTPLGTTGAGTSVMSGAVLDFNGFTVGTAEALTINGRGINDGGAVIGANVTFAGTIAQATDSRITNTSGTFTISGAVSAAFNLYVGGAGNTTFSTAIPTAGLSLTKEGAGTLTVTGTNLFTGATNIRAGTFAYASTTTLAGTNLIIKGGTFNSGANADTIGTVTLIGGTITNSAALTAATSYTLESGTISGILAGAIPVVKNTNNTVTLTGVNTISSTTTINAGTLTISGSGSATATTITVNLGGTLTLDNTTTAVASRLGDALALTMNGGNFNFIGNTAGASSETTGALTLSAGHNIITVTPGAGGSTTMTFASLSRTAGAMALFRGTNLGSNAAANVSTLVFTAAPALTGAGGASGSATVSVIKGAFGDSSLSGTGSDMVTYQGGVGLRLLNGAGFSGEYTGDLQTANGNVKLTADRAAVATNTNSLILNGFSITNPGGAVTIPISSASLAGNILINSATNIAGANTTLGIGTTELDILATANSTISAVIGTAVAGSVVIGGYADVTLSAANLYTGTTFITDANVIYGINNVISSGGVTIVDGTLNLNGNSDTVGAISLTASTISTGAGTLTGNGSFTVATNANYSSIINGNLGLGANATFTIGDGLVDNDAVISAVISGAFTFAKAGTGVLELAGSNSYSGATTVSAGTLRLGAAGGATNTPLGTTAAGTTISGASTAFDLNGYTLGTAEALTLSGAVATGALQNTSSTAVSYSGLITIGANASIISNYGDINITNTGNITGNTFALTIGGAGNGTLASNLNTTTGTLTKNGLGTWTLSGSSSYTGLTTISVGTIKLGAAGGATNTPLGTTGTGTTISSGAVLDLNGFTLGTAEAITMSGAGIANIGAFINSSNSSVSFSGATILAAAARIVNHGTGLFILSGNMSGNFARTIVTVGDVTQSAGVWSGTGSLIKEGSGRLILSGQNSTTGAMTVSTGVLQLGANGGAANTPFGTNAGGVTVSAGAVVDLNIYTLGGASTYETLNLSGSGIKNAGALISTASGISRFGAMTVAANSRVINSGAGTIIFGGTITAANGINLGIGGTGSTTISGVYGATATSATMTKWDAGTLTVSAASITTGLVRVNGGTLSYGINDAFATGALTVAGGTLNLGTFNETNIGTVTLISGSIINSNGTASITSTATVVAESGTISAVLGSAVAAGIAKNSAGRFILSGNNTFTSTSIAVNAGYLNLTHSNALGAAGTALTTTISAGATLELENSITIPSVKAITVNGTGVANAGAIRNISGTNSIGANVVLGTTNVRINSDSGTLTFPTMSGNTFNSIFGGAGATTVSGIISTTTGGLTKDGAGTLTLSGVNTFTGATNLIEGTIIANSTSSIGDGSATNTLIFRGGTLQATGTITSPINRAINLYSGVGTIDTNGNAVSLAGTVGSGGGLTKTGAGTLTITGATTIGGDLNISTGTLVTPATITLKGDFTNTSGTPLDAGSSNIIFDGTADQSITEFNTTGTTTMSKTSGIVTLTGDISGGILTINGVGGTLNLGAGLTHAFTGAMNLTNGSIDGNTSNISTTNFSSSNSNTRTVSLGTGTWTLTGTGTVWDMATSTGATVTGGTSTIKITDSSVTGKTFAGGGNTYGNIWFAPGTGSGSFTISGNNTFANFRDDGSVAHSILFTTGSTQHFSSWNVIGNPGQLITIDSTTTGTHSLVMDGAGSVVSDYLNIQHSVVSPSVGRWFAGTNSVDNQNVASAGSGWIFQVEVIYRGGGGGAAGGESVDGGGGGVGGGGSGGGGGGDNGGGGDVGGGGSGGGGDSG
jgi:autotransporter-associated beta strand protein